MKLYNLGLQRISQSHGLSNKSPSVRHWKPHFKLLVREILEIPTPDV